MLTADFSIKHVGFYFLDNCWRNCVVAG